MLGLYKAGHQHNLWQFNCCFAHDSTSGSLPIDVQLGLRSNIIEPTDIIRSLITEGSRGHFLQ